MPGVITRKGRREMARAWNGIAFRFDANHRLMLIKNDFVLTANPGPGDIVEATFGGYEARDVVLDGPGVPVADGDDWIVKLGVAEASWDCTSAPHNVYGWGLFCGDDSDFWLLYKYAGAHILDVGIRHTIVPSLRIGSCGGGIMP